MKSYRDMSGDGGSAIAEQVAGQRSRIRESLAGVRHLLAVGSGKGGVGKSTLTRHLATSLRREGHSVAILDADLNGPSQARLAGMRDAPLVPERGRLSMPRCPDGVGVVSLGSLVPDSDALDFESVVKGDSHVWRATREFAFLGQLLGAVDWGRQDVLLIDLPPGAEKTVQYAEFLGDETAFVLVTLPSDLSLGVVSRSIAALRKTPNRILGYVENMAGYYCHGCREVKPLFPDSGEIELGIPRLGRVPFDSRLAASEEIRAISLMLIGMLEGEGDPS